MRKPLDETQLTAAVATLTNWHLENGELIRLITFADFNQAMEFVNRVAAFAEGANHHPDIDIRYNRVRLALVTHDAGGITQSDIDLAATIENQLLI
jgi:4a-hydroxytetrahydrobiopterin dehydratase